LYIFIVTLVCTRAGCFSPVETLYLVRFQRSARCSSLDRSM